MSNELPIIIALGTLIALVVVAFVVFACVAVYKNRRNAQGSAPRDIEQQAIPPSTTQYDMQPVAIGTNPQHAVGQSETTKNNIGIQVPHTAKTPVNSNGVYPDKGSPIFVIGDASPIDPNPKAQRDPLDSIYGGYSQEAYDRYDQEARREDNRQQTERQLTGATLPTTAAIDRTNGTFTTNTAPATFQQNPCDGHHEREVGNKLGTGHRPRSSVYPDEKYM